MQCPDCGSSHIRKNGKMRGKQNHICVDCHRQFWEHLPDAYDPATPPEVGELDELETFVGSKKTKSGYGQPLTTFSKGF